MKKPTRFTPAVVGEAHRADMRLVRYLDYRGEWRTEWEVWSGGVCVATLGLDQVKRAAAVEA